MQLPTHKTKIVCTIGPASDSLEMMQRLLRAGMNVARVNFSHGDFASHARVIADLRRAAELTGKRLAILADLPGPKIRIGQLATEPLELPSGGEIILTTAEVLGDLHRLSVPFAPLPQVVHPGDKIYINDGFIDLEVIHVQGQEVRCRVIVGGLLRSKKGVNLPGIDLGISAFTDHDRACLQAALACGVDAVSQSFVESAADIEALRQAATALGYNPFVIAKIERSRALANLEEIFQAADGIMIARGDLGVEVPIEQVPVVQKRVTHRANILGKPVITATQMLESMTASRRPTRAEATDVANAILDGTDCVMLSGESAVGRFPEEAVAMLGKIAAAIEPHRSKYQLQEILNPCDEVRPGRPADIIAASVGNVLEKVSPAAIFVPTRSGATARSIARFHPQEWIVAISSEPATCQNLQFSYGVFPVYEPDHPANWKDFIRQWLKNFGLGGNLAILTEGPSRRHPETNNRMEIISLE
ncbi:MAG: pyruvate kinase [Desulfobacca sp.]|uniref:pyruvate kinase n=1 Tax=Desulfobacca sp. TaxID=2067990 RepID=UPI00404925DF